MRKVVIASGCWVKGLAASALVALAGCAPLTDVAKFSQLSSETAQYTKLLDYTSDSYERLQRAHLDPATLDLEKKTADSFKKALPDLKKIHEAVGGYMAVLGQLADANVPSALDKPIDELGKAITANQKAYGFEVKKEHADAYAVIAKIVADWVISGVRRHEIQQLLDPAVSNHVRTLLQAMMDIGVELDKQLRDEISMTRNSLALYYKVDRRQAQEPLAVMLAQEKIRAEEEKLQEQRKQFQTFGAAIKKVDEGLGQLVSRRGKLDNDEAKTVAQALWKQLRQIQSQLKNLD